MFNNQQKVESILRQLRMVQEKYENKFVPTFELRVGDMAKDSADSIDILLEEIEHMKTYKLFTDAIRELPNCDTCANIKWCKYKVEWEENKRYNCPLYVPPSKKEVI